MSNENWITIPADMDYLARGEGWRKGDFHVAPTVISLSPEQMCRHLLLLGSTGSGKGWTWFTPAIASCKVPFCYQDVKSELPGLDTLQGLTGETAIRWGAAAQGGWPSMSWNPLEECRQDDQPTEAFAALAAALVPSKGHDDWVSALTQPILAWVFETGGYATLGDINDAFVRDGVDKTLDNAGLPTGLIAALQGKNVREYLGTTAFSALRSFRSGWGRATTSRHEFGLDDLCRSGGYVLSAEPEIGKRKPLFVFWQMLFRKLLLSNQRRNLALFLDEAVAAGKISDSAIDALVTLRSKGISITYGAQSVAGLLAAYGPQEGQALVDSFVQQVTLLSGLSQRDAEALSRRFGNKSVRVRHRNSDDTYQSVPLLSVDMIREFARADRRFYAVLDLVGPSGDERAKPILCELRGYRLGGMTRSPEAEDLAEFAAWRASRPQPPPPTRGEASEALREQMAEAEAIVAGLSGEQVAAAMGEPWEDPQAAREFAAAMGDDL